MSVIEITSMSTKGQVVIPANMRKKLNIRGGSKLIVVQEGDNILLKPIERPRDDEFNKIIELADQLRKEIDLKEGDVLEVIKESRKSSARRS